MKWLLLIPAALLVFGAAAALIGAFLPRDHVGTRSVTFRQTPAALFSVVRDFASLPTWRSDVRSVDILPFRDGCPCHRETTRHGTVNYLVRELRVNERLVLEIADENLPYGGRWIFEFFAASGGTELRITEEGFVKNVIFRFLARFAFGHAASLEGYLGDLAKKFAEPPPNFP